MSLMGYLSPFFIYLLPAIILFGLAIFVLIRNVKSTDNIFISLINFFFASWFLADFTRIMLPIEFAKMITIYWYIPSVVFINISNFFLYYFSATLSRRKRYVFLFLLPILLFLFIAPIPDWIHSGYIKEGLWVRDLPGKYYYISTICFGAYGVFFYLFLINLLNNAKRKFDQNKYRIYLIAHTIGLSWLIGFAFINTAEWYSNINMPNLIMHGSLFQSVVLTWAMIKFNYLPSNDSRFKILNRLSPVGNILINQSGNILEANPSFYKLFGRSHEEKASLISYLDQQDHSFMLGLIEDSFTQNNAFINEEITLYMQNKQHKMSFILNSTFISWKDEIYQYLIFQDITAIKEANEKIVSMESNRRHLMSNISHDLRSPITSIRGYIEGILDGVIDSKEKISLYMSRALNRVLDLQKLIDDLFYVSKLESKEIPMNSSRVSVASLLNVVFERFEIDLLKSGIRLHIILDKRHKSEFISIDFEKMLQVYSNILLNAMKHSNTSFVQLEAELNEKEVLLKIIDYGEGIPIDKLPFIFERFFTSDTSRNHQYSGTGLGLAICKEIVNRHEGNIWAINNSDKGVTFYISLPISKDEQHKVDVVKTIVSK